MRNFHFAGRSTVHAQNAMVATSHPEAALVAIDVMRAGGTAADAAVAACALLGVIEPQATGIGGDCFARIQPKGEGKIVAYNGSGRAPMAATAEWHLERKIHSVPLTSAHAVSIPGAIDAWDTILRDHGKMGLDTLLQPAIKAAEEGYIVAPRIAFDWKNQFEKLKNGTNTERYLLPHGKPAVAGDVIHQPELGKTLRAIAKDGRDAFYEGAIAEDMVETLRGIGGLHTLEDFAAHTTETTSPIGTMYKGLDVWQCPPNGPGIGILLQNRAGGFRIQVGHPNCIAPGKRPLHTIIPALVTKAGRAVMPFGVMGGQYQPVGQVHVLTNMLDYGCDVQEAIDMPRGLHYEGIYQLEDGVPPAIVEGLKKLGHKTVNIVAPLGGGQAIWIDWDKGTLTAGSDPRKDGCALGY